LPRVQGDCSERATRLTHQLPVSSARCLWISWRVDRLLTLRRPALTRAILLYRHRRLAQARAAARAAGSTAHCFPGKAGGSRRIPRRLSRETTRTATSCSPGRCVAARLSSAPHSLLVDLTPSTMVLESLPRSVPPIRIRGRQPDSDPAHGAYLPVHTRCLGAQRHHAFNELVADTQMKKRSTAFRPAFVDRSTLAKWILNGHGKTQHCSSERPAHARIRTTTVGDTEPATYHQRRILGSRRGWSWTHGARPWRVHGTTRRQVRRPNRLCQ
jgi:hypothetical protein